MALYKKILRNMLEHKTQYLAALILVILSTALFTSFYISGPQTNHQLKAFKKDYNVEDAEFITNKNPGNIEKLEKKFHIQLERRKIVEVSVLNKATLRIMERTAKINKYQITSGRDLKNSNDIVLNKDFVEKNGMTIGDKLSIKGTEYRISGYIAEPDYFTMAKNEGDMVPDLYKFGIGIVGEKAISSLDKGYFIYCVRFQSHNEEAFKRYVNNKYIIMKWLSRDDNPRISAVDGDVGGFFTVGQIVPLIILIITSMLISIVEWRTIKNEFSQMGTLYAIGYSKKKILFHYLSYPISIVIIGGLIGQIPGVLLTRPLLATQEMQYNLPVIDFTIKPGVILLSLVLPFAIIIPACIYVIFRALRLSPVQLMKGTLTEGGPSFLEKAISLRGLKFDTRFKIREIIRNVPRSLLAFISIMFASMLLLFGFIMSDSINWMFDNGYGNSFKYEHFYSFNSLKFEADKNGEKVFLQTFVGKKDSGEEVNIKLQGMEKDAKLIRLVDDKGKRIPFSKNIMTAPLAKKLGVSEGEMVRIRSKIDNKLLRVRLDKIADSYIGDYIFIPIQRFYKDLGFPNGSYTGVISKKALDFDKASIMTEFTKKDMTAAFENMVKPLKAMLYIIALVASLIGLILIYIVTSLIIEENRMNISLLKIIGYSKKRIYSLILNTNTIVVVLGYIVSLPVIKISMDSLFQEVTKKMDYSIPAKLGIQSIIFGFLIVIITYGLAKMLARNKVISIPMTEVLKASRE